MGQVELDVRIKGVVKKCCLIVVKDVTKLLLGRDLFKKFDLNVSNKEVILNKLEISNIKIDAILEKYSSVFHSTLGKYKEKKIHLELIEAAKPIFHKPRPIPFAFREKVMVELNRLESLRVIEKKYISLGYAVGTGDEE